MSHSRDDKPLTSLEPRPRLRGVSEGRFRRGRHSRFPTSVFITMVAATILAVGISGWLAATGGQPKEAPTRDKALQHARTRHALSTTTVTSVTTTTNPGSLPQTDAFPEVDSAQFQYEMSALWTGIVTDSLTAALPAFFPEQAYEQLKTIGDAQSDYEGRLVRDYSLDITAAHNLLVAGPSSAVLVGVDVPAHYGHWVPPGVCDNQIGYFEVANSRLVYEQGGISHSFGIASFISWRGVWYVVHLGAILRSTDTGVVDDPEIGPGTSEPSSTC